MYVLNAFDISLPKDPQRHVQVGLRQSRVRGLVLPVITTPGGPQSWGCLVSVLGEEGILLFEIEVFLNGY